MNCLECLDSLQERLDGITSGDDKSLEAHLASCPSCREQHGAGLRLLHLLAIERPPTPTSGLSQRIFLAVVQDRQDRRKRLRRRLIITASLAASVLLMLLINYGLMTRTLPHQQNDSPLVKEEKPLPKPTIQPQIQINADHPKPTLTALTERLADKTRDHALVLLTAANPLENLPMNDLPPTIREIGSTQPLKEAGQEVTQGVENVTRSAREAFNYFARELPWFESTQPQ